MMMLGLLILSLTLTVGAVSDAHANAKYAGIVVDVKSGKTLYADNADRLRYPASLTKIMTLYMLFGQLESGKVSLNTRLRVSKRAAGMQPSKLGLRAGTSIKVKDAILALVTKSANDVAVVVAEHIGGTESNFAKMMTRTARSIGMSKTTFRNASGLPNSGQRTTARDMARLGIAIQDRFPQYFKYFSTRTYSYKGKGYRNHNRLLGNVRGVDGIKTGYIRASGFNLVTSVNKGNRRVVAVVMGGRTGRSRDAHMRDLISRYFRKATRGARTTKLIASRSVPLPRARATALAAVDRQQTIVAAAIPTARPDPIITASITPQAPVQASAQSSLQLRPAQTAQNTAPAASAAPTALPVPGFDPEFGSADGYENTDIPDGWQIQIGALPSEEAAGILLSSALGVGANHLSGKVPFTEPVIANGQTLHRARFAGFSNKNAAWAACAYLETQDFACLATR